MSMTISGRVKLARFLAATVCILAIGVASTTFEFRQPPPRVEHLARSDRNAQAEIFCGELATFQETQLVMRFRFQNALHYDNHRSVFRGLDVWVPSVQPALSVFAQSGDLVDEEVGLSGMVSVESASGFHAKANQGTLTTRGGNLLLNGSVRFGWARVDGSATDFDYQSELRRARAVGNVEMRLPSFGTSWVVRSSTAYFDFETQQVHLLSETQFERRSNTLSGAWALIDFSADFKEPMFIHVFDARVTRRGKQGQERAAIVSIGLLREVDGAEDWYLTPVAGATPAKFRYRQPSDNLEFVETDSVHGPAIQLPVEWRMKTGWGRATDRSTKVSATSAPSKQSRCITELAQ